ncbi:MAG: pyruvate kinase alpha/beta domain-containing protein [Syntrophorhabdales bacterium]|jgi:hypothetical protein
MHFERAGIANTEKTLEIAFNYARDNHVGHIVVASTGGSTARIILDRFPYESFNIVVVTHNTGFKEAGVQDFPDALRDELALHGIRVLTGTMVLRSLGTAIKGFTGYSQEELVAGTLRMICQGMKVCVEIIAMACDAGLIPPSDVVAIAGTGRGADTACLIKGDSSNRFFQIKVREILAKPKEF